MPDFDTTGMKEVRTGLWIDPGTGALQADLPTILRSRGLEINASNESMLAKELAEQFSKAMPAAPVVDTIGFSDPAPVRMVRCTCVHGHIISMAAYERGTACSFDIIEQLSRFMASRGVKGCRCGESRINWTDLPTNFATYEDAGKWVIEHCTAENERNAAARQKSQLN